MRLALFIKSIFRAGNHSMAPPENKKAAVAEHPEVFDHAGLLFNGRPSSPGLPFV